MAITLVKTTTERRSALWLDALVLLGVAALVLGLGRAASELRHPLHEAVTIELSPAALPKYAFFSFLRGWVAYFFSLLFALVVGSWAFYDPRARRYIIPALDILQSIPVLGFLPGLTLALIAIFPRNNVGLELTCVVAIFTGQVWNMAFSYYDSLRGTPGDFRMLGKLYNLNWWHRFWRIELPFGAQGLLYNSMVSMAGGWFYLAVCEAPPPIGNQSLRVPGLGSYMQEAIDRGDVRAQIFGAAAMAVVIVIVDRLIWWPLILWSKKFKMDDFGGNRAPKTRLQLWFARSWAGQASGALGRTAKKVFLPPVQPPSAATSLMPPEAPLPHPSPAGRVVYAGILVAVGALLLAGAWRMVELVGHVGWREWMEIVRVAGFSLLRVLCAVLLGTLWTVPFGIWIGLNPKLSGRLQPFIQFAASFPAPMIYPWLTMLVFLVHGSLQWGAIALILFGTQWYILFNVAGAAAAIPNDMISCANILRLSGWRRWSKFLIPAVLPGLVTGWLTAAGGAWNATIVSEVQTIGGKSYVATGLGAYISDASNNNRYANLAAAVLVMAVIVVGLNRTLWKRLQVVANDRCRFIT